MTARVVRTVPPQGLIDVANPVVRAVLGSPLHRLLSRALIVLHVTGRRSGVVYDVPVGFVESADRLLVVTQHRWRANLRGGADVEVTRDGQRQAMRASLREDPDDVAQLCAEVIRDLGWRRARRWLGIRTESGGAPTGAELRAAAAELDLAIVVLVAQHGSAA